MTVAELHFKAKWLYWKYWVIPRDGNINRKLELEVPNWNGSFVQYEAKDIPLQIPLMAFRSSVPLKSKERGGERINLYEILPSGIRRPLLRNLDAPVLGKLPFKTEDTAVDVVYI
ncbi:MAG: hypothetical protein LUE99_18970 [Bacteroides sp.]|nr:hypothetical protein [Bacteroides sp.]